MPLGETLPELAVSVPTQSGSLGRDMAGLDAQVINSSDSIETNNLTSAELPVTQLAQPVDLVVDLSRLGPFRQGHTATVTATVANTGADPSSGEVTVQLTAPRLQEVLASGSGWTCTTTTLTCSHASPVAAGGTLPPIALTFNTPTHDAVGEYQITAEVTNTSDADTTNNSTQVEGAAGGIPVDLTATLTGLQPLTGGEHGSFTTTITNSGTSPSTGQITVRLNAPNANANATGTNWTCTTTLICSNPGPTNPNTTLTPITTTYTTPNQNSPVTMEASASVSNESDAVTSDNQASIPQCCGWVAQLTSSSGSRRRLGSPKASPAK